MEEPGHGIVGRESELARMRSFGRREPTVVLTLLSYRAKALVYGRALS